MKTPRQKGWNRRSQAKGERPEKKKETVTLPCVISQNNEEGGGGQVVGAKAMTLTESEKLEGVET